MKQEIKINRSEIRIVTEDSKTMPMAVACVGTTWSCVASRTVAPLLHVLRCNRKWTDGHYQRSWQMLGLEKYWPLVNVDKASPPYGNTRRLITDCNVDNNPNRAHTTVIPGGTACKDSEGRFIYENVWLYLFTHPIDQTGEPDPANTK